MTTKQQVARHAKSEANSAKSCLIDILRSLEGAGCLTEARKLDRIICRLETWQNS